MKEVTKVEMRRFEDEVHTWQKLRHPNVVQFYGANLQKEPFFIVSEYALNGEFPKYLMKQKKQGCDVAWRKLKEVAAGLKYLHDQGIVHGDLKGNNIVVSSDGTAKLTDFGLSFVESGSCSVVTEKKDTLGAMAWRAPEFANMTIMTPTRKSDAYSLGMCIIEAVTGKNPWGRYPEYEIRTSLREGKVLVKKPDELTDDQWALVRRMISVDSESRPDLDEVIAELEKNATEEEEGEHEAA